jgi:catechol 2,3-dioxygenase-like lactoylglutathione lyase family enzyme
MVRAPPIMAGMAARKKTKPTKRPARTTPRRPLGRGRSSGPCLTVVTLGVQNLARSRTFYEALGFRPSSSSNESIVFVDAGVVLALYRRKLLADDANIPSEGSGFGGVTLARNVRSKAEVDAALEVAKKAGAAILKPAQEAFWGGYSGYFADPDGYPWEVAYNPHWTLDANGQVVLPK